MTAEDFLSRLDAVKACGPGRWVARCVSHPDKNPSLSVREVGTRLLLKCWSGCQTSDIVAVLGLTMRDLFTDSPIPSNLRSIPTPRKVDPRDLAFRFELGALDRRIRAQRVLTAAKNYHP